MDKNTPSTKVSNKLHVAEKKKKKEKGLEECIAYKCAPIPKDDISNYAWNDPSLPRIGNRR